MTIMETLSDIKFQEVKKLNQTFLKLLQSKDSQRFYTFLEGDYISGETELITPNGEIVHSEELIPFYHRFFDPIFQNYYIDGKFYDENFSISGELAIHRYSYRMDLTPRDSGEKIVEIGHGIKTYRKHLDGKWRLQYDIWTNPE